MDKQTIIRLCHKIYSELPQNILWDLVLMRVLVALEHENAEENRKHKKVLKAILKDPEEWNSNGEEP